MRTTTRLPSAVRFTIARITDLAIDVGLAGRYDTHTALDMTHRYRLFSLDTMPVGKRHTDPEAVNLTCSMDAILEPGWGGFTPREALEHCQQGLGEMITHLEALLAEGPADNQEEQPS